MSSGVIRQHGLQMWNRSGRIPVSAARARRRYPPIGIFIMSTTIAMLIALILLPVLFLLWLTESRQQRARRWRRDGWTQQRIADRLGCSRSTVRRMLTA